MSNVIYPAYLEVSRLQFFAAAGDPEPIRTFAFAHLTAELRLRYVAACYYDEPLRVGSKLTALGRSSATLDQVITGEGPSLRALARISVVRSAPGGATVPWTDAQRAALAMFSGLTRAT